MDFYNIKPASECLLNKQCNDTASRISSPPHLQIGKSSTALDFNNPRSSEWMNWVDPKFGKRTRKDPCKARMVCCCNKKYSAGNNGSSNTYKDALNTLNPVNFLVVVSCKVCMKYMMVNQEIKACPNCGEGLIQFEQERCFPRGD